jgi:hypothetical protein
MPAKINPLALIAGISTLLLIVISLFVPWWHFTAGNPAVAAVNVSPVYVDLSLFGEPVVSPLVWALAIGGALTLACGGIVMLVYALRPNRSYSKKLLGFGYTKPLYAVVIFAAALLSLNLGLQSFAGVSFPIQGSGTLMLPEGILPEAANLSVNVSAGFGWAFYFAIAVAALCIAARVYHRKIPLYQPPATTPPPAQQS